MLVLALPDTVAAQVPAGSADLATFVWDAETVERAELRAALLQFGRARGLRTLYVHIGRDQAGELDGLSALAAGAADAGMELVALGGDPHWALSDKHGDAL